MTKLQLKIITNAVRIRVERGEDIDEVLTSYTKLTDAEKEQIKAAIQG